MRTITVEEHFAPPGFLDGPGKDLKESFLRFGPRGQKLIAQIEDFGAGRVAEMDAAGIDMQVLSINAPGVEQLDAAVALSLAHDSNDALGEAVKKFPTRFAGLAALATMVPDKAAAEFERTVRTLGFKGALINGHTRGRYLDDKFFWPILERAQALNVPIYLHPTVPAKPVADLLYGALNCKRISRRRVVVACFARPRDPSCWRTCAADSASPPPNLPLKCPHWRLPRWRGQAE